MRIKRVLFGYAKLASQIATRGVKKVRRYQLRFFAPFNSMAKNSHVRKCMAFSLVPLRSIVTAPMLAQPTTLQVLDSRSGVLNKQISVDHCCRVQVSITRSTCHESRSDRQGNRVTREFDSSVGIQEMRPAWMETVRFILVGAIHRIRSDTGSLTQPCSTRIGSV